MPCHGDHSERQGPLLFRLHWHAPEIRHQVRIGNSLMPAIPVERLSDEDLEHLLAFFLTTGACAAEPGIEDEEDDALEDDTETPEEPDDAGAPPSPARALGDPRGAP